MARGVANGEEDGYGEGGSGTSGDSSPRRVFRSSVSVAKRAAYELGGIG